VSRINWRTTAARRDAAPRVLPSLRAARGEIQATATVVG
jgi:hypothetical protein